MSQRKALLIGAEEYGDGFARLNAVREDVAALSAALKLSEERVGETSKLDRAPPDEKGDTCKQNS